MGITRTETKRYLDAAKDGVFIPPVPDKPRRHGRRDGQPDGPRDAGSLGRSRHDAEEVVDVSRALWFDICIVSHDRYDQLFPERVRSLAKITDCVLVDGVCVQHF